MSSIAAHPWSADLRVGFRNLQVLAPAPIPNTVIPERKRCPFDPGPHRIPCHSKSRMQDLTDLIAQARQAQAHAYAPYSGYHVGAAVRAADGRIFAGCNVENVSYGATICAERSAIANMIAAGGKEIVEILVLTKDGGSPCGVCRQVIAEFVPNLEEVLVHMADAHEQVRSVSLLELFPLPFRSAAVERTES